MFLILLTILKEITLWETEEGVLDSPKPGGKCWIQKQACGEWVIARWHFVRLIFCLEKKKIENFFNDIQIWLNFSKFYGVWRTKILENVKVLLVYIKLISIPVCWYSLGEKEYWWSCFKKIENDCSCSLWVAFLCPIFKNSLDLYKN